MKNKIVMMAVAALALAGLPTLALCQNRVLDAQFNDTGFTVKVFGNGLIIYDGNHNQFGSGRPVGGSRGVALEMNGWDLFDLQGNNLGTVTRRDDGDYIFLPPL